MNIYDLAVKSHIENITDTEFEYILSNQDDKYLYVEDNILKLHYKDKELFIDFNSSEILNRIDPKTKKCSVVQAVEGRSKDKLNILDTTAGLGRDTFTLAARGHRLISLEKDCYIFLLLVDALNRAKQTSNLKDIANQIDLINIDANEYINTTNISFDCIYIDPMFPPRNKSAKVKQGMQVLHDIAFNNDESNSNLLKNIILSKKTKKAVVKRPINADFLYGKKPTSQLKGKTNRFDVYSL
ncbi:class I SAM-dependent methyltransferase [Francisella philomiragia]|uniref:Ribosomal RNA small subunit methyltransferase J n=1 Tax=Francisella philomiragia TaxID=28110 RepID=A0A0B6D2N4_9GAMM|nr:class I SAM-dependent methyltransferase [Francisella philomiragia]AJI52597.1 SAM-dependent methyltransferase family protein [Francisella philomiragia]